MKTPQLLIDALRDAQQLLRTNASVLRTVRVSASARVQLNIVTNNLECQADEISVVIEYVTGKKETPEKKCRKCGCTDSNCSGCVERTGTPCYWVSGEDPPVCSACWHGSLLTLLTQQPKAGAA